MTAPVKRQLIYAEFRILELLPDEGSMTGTFRELAWPVKQIHKTLKEHGDISAGQINGLTKSMHARGLVVQVQLMPRGQGMGYQITKKGKEELREYAKKHERIQKPASGSGQGKD